MALNFGKNLQIIDDLHGVENTMKNGSTIAKK